MTDSDSPAIRPDDDDHDLLTYGEAGVRIDQEVRAQAARVQELESSGADESTVVSARTRLDLLVETAERNARQPINDETFAKFFGYEGKAQRNT